MKKKTHRKRKSSHTKSILRLLDLEVAKTAAISSLSCPGAQRGYLLREFCDWADSTPYMAGTVLSEFNGDLAKGELTKNDCSQKEIDERF